MKNVSSDVEVAEFEDVLKSVTLASWNRVRSTQELQDFIERHHSALTEIEL
jgi:hypothetical protein